MPNLVKRVLGCFGIYAPKETPRMYKETFYMYSEKRIITSTGTVDGSYDSNKETTVSSLVYEEFERVPNRANLENMNKTCPIYLKPKTPNHAQSHFRNIKKEMTRNIDTRKHSFANDFITPGAVQEDDTEEMKKSSKDKEMKKDISKSRRTNSADAHMNLGYTRNRPQQELTQSNKAQEENLRKAFLIFDRNCDGRISREEMRRAIQSLGYESNEEEISIMLDKADSNRNGTIEFDEFIQVMSELPETSQNESSGVENELQAMFKIFDINKDGRITAQELCYAMKTLGENLTKKELEDMMRLADSNGDGIIDFQEFQNLFRMYDESLERPNTLAVKSH